MSFVDLSSAHCCAAKPVFSVFCRPISGIESFFRFSCRQLHSITCSAMISIISVTKGVLLESAIETIAFLQSAAGRSVL